MTPYVSAMINIDTTLECVGLCLGASRKRNALRQVGTRCHMADFYLPASNNNINIRINKNISFCEDVCCYL
jgi:hypothetical protein